MDGNKPLSASLRSMLDWRWSEFVKLERRALTPTDTNSPAAADEDTITGSMKVVITLIRAAASGNLASIRLSLDRIDGRMEKKIRIEVPKFYTLYPYAKGKDGLPSPTPLSSTQSPGESLPVKRAKPKSSVAELSLRDTLVKMSEHDARLPTAIVEQAQLVETEIMNPEDTLHHDMADPLVKSVISAAFLVSASGTKSEGVTKIQAELFEQLEGKLEKVVRLVGDDIYITKFDAVAPHDAVLNENGQWQREESAMTATWRSNLIDDGDDNEDSRYDS